MKRGLAAVTGGTGFLGRRVVERLTAEGWRVRQLVRTPRPGITEAVEGSLTDEGALARLVEGVDLVVHMAALTKCHDAKGFRQINVGGSRNLGHAIRAHAPSAKVVVVSSLAAREPTLSPYAASKAAGEVAVLDCSNARCFAVVRPCALYGPGDPATLPVFRAAQLPILPFPDRPLARLALLHVDDAASAIAAACRPQARNVFWEVGAGAFSWARVFRSAAAAMDRDPAMLPVPAGLLALGIKLVRAVKPGISPLTSPGKLAELLHDDWACDPARLPPDALWRPGIELDAGFKATAQWYRAHGWL
ncbi:MAG TPA: NAD(P)-dependent oxidoreductase [Candidatus Omnitrophota bacterium]|nr:NAD(P)-dependent oxidoreductase [Candidatus Omnitrophota bacterium]